jgi:hypothetical protein
MPVKERRAPDGLTALGAESFRDRVTDIEVLVLIDGKTLPALNSGITLDQDIVEDCCGLLVDYEGVDLKNDLDKAMAEGEEEVNDCELRHGDAIPLSRELFMSA